MCCFCATFLCRWTNSDRRVVKERLYKATGGTAVKREERRKCVGETALCLRQWRIIQGYWTLLVRGKPLPAHYLWPNWSQWFFLSQLLVFIVRRHAGRPKSGEYCNFASQTARWEVMKRLACLHWVCSQGSRAHVVASALFVCLSMCLQSSQR